MKHNLNVNDEPDFKRSFTVSWVHFIYKYHAVLKGFSFKCKLDL